MRTWFKWERRSDSKSERRRFESYWPCQVESGVISVAEWLKAAAGEAAWEVSHQRFESFHLSLPIEPKEKSVAAANDRVTSTFFGETKTPCRTFSATFKEEGQIDCATKPVLKTDEAKSPWGFESLSFRQSITPGCCADGYTRQLWELNFAGSNPVTQTIYFLIMRGSVQSTSGS